MAEGYVMTIPKSVLDKLTQADEKIKNIAKSSENTEKRVVESFKNMANGINPFLEKLNALKSLSSLKIEGTLKSSATAAEKTANSVAQVATQLNRVAESPLDVVNRKILSLKDLLDQSVSASQKMQTQMAAINQGGGVISKKTLTEGSAGSSLTTQIQAELKALELERNLLQQNEKYWKRYIENLTGSSIASQRQKTEMDKLNASFRNGNSLLQRQTRAEDEFGKAVGKAVTALDKAARAEERKNAARSNKEAQAAARAEEQYARALTRSEVTIVQRARKIEALTNAQRALTATGRDYADRLARITSETQRLQKANNDAANSMDKLKSNQSKVLDISGQLARQFALLFSVSAINGYVNKLVAVRGEFELQQRALQAIIQDKDEANKIWEKTVALAVRSPFQVKELVTYTKQLAAYRIESSKLYDTTKMLADVSAGLGVDMGRLILAYGQVKAANYLRASEVRQFTEAGVNILGELANIYSELEGRMVSVGEIQDRITRRMIKFGDVEEVFKRITSAGGIFYNMQEIQAETLAGLISNLKDNFDIMFNDIGKANDGVLKGFIGIINSIVANWRYFADALNAASIGFVLYTAKIVIATMSTGGFTAATIKAMIAQGGLSAAIAKTVNVSKGLGAFLKSNLWIAVASAIAAAGFALRDNYKRVEEIKASYDALNGSLNTQKQKLDDLINRYEKSISSQADLNGQLGNLKKGSDEYNSIQNKLNDAKKEELKVLNELQTKYPEIYASLNGQKNAVAALRQEQSKYNKELEATKLLNYQVKQSEPYFGKGFKETLDSYSNSLVDQANAADNLKYSYLTLEDELRMFLKEYKYMSQQQKDTILSVLDSSDSIEKKAIALNKAIATATAGKRYSAWVDDFFDFQKALGEYINTTNEAEESTENMNEKFDDILKRALAHLGVTIKTFNTLNNEQKRELESTLRTFIRSVSEDEKVLNEFKDRVKDTLNFEISLDIPKPDKMFSDAQKALNNAIEKYNKTQTADSLKLQLIEPEEDINTYIDKIYKSGEAWENVSARNAKSIQNLNPEINKQKDLVVKMTKDAAKAQKTLAESFGYIDKKSSKSEESAYSKKLSAQLSLLKKLQSQYEKLRQTMGDSDATSTITNSFVDAYRNLFSKPLSLKFDKASIANEMESISNTIGGKASAELKRSWDSAASQLRAEVAITATVDNIESFERDIESMFNSYQLSIELETKGVSKDVIKDLFGIDVATLDDIKKQLEDKYPDISKLGEKQLDSYFKIQKQITDNEKRELQRRSNLLLDYLAQSVDKVKQVQNSGALKISIATDFFNKGKLDAEQYATVIKNITDEVNRDVSKINLQKFKETPEYIRAMGDLSAYSKSQLESLIAKMREFISQSAGNLSASDLKVYSDAIDKIQNQLEKTKSPFSKNAFAEAAKIKKLQKEYNQELENQNRLLEEQKQKEQELADAKQRAQEVQNDPNATKDDIAAAAEEVNVANDNLSETNNKLNISEGKLGNISGKMGQLTGGMSAAMAMADKIITGIYQSINATIDIMNQFKDLAESNGVDVSVGGWREAQQAGEILGNVNEKVMSSWNNFKSGNIAGAVADAVGSITTIFTTLNRQHDKRREQKIEKEIKLVNELTRAYEHLSRNIENAYTIDTLNASYENAQRNLEQQIESTQRMIAAEQDKKKKDDERIKEWQDELIKYEEQLEDLRNKKVKDLGGFGSGADMKSAAEEFTSAWMEAYMETGDGLDALNEKWDEFIQNIIVKQLALRGISKFLEPIMKQIDAAIGNDSYLSSDELAKIKENIEKLNPLMNDFLKDMMEGFGDLLPKPGSNNTELSGLSSSIQGVTEDTADIIAGYLNSIRFFVADSNMQLQTIALFFSADPAQNPMYSEMMAQTRLLRSIDDRLASVITSAGNHPLSGFAIKSII